MSNYRLLQPAAWNPNMKGIKAISTTMIPLTHCLLLKTTSLCGAYLDS